MVKIITPRQTLKIFIGILVLAIIAAGIAVYFILKSGKPEAGPAQTPEKTAGEVLDGLAAPVESGVEAQERILKSLSAPSGSSEVAEEILQSLTAPKISNE